MEGIVQLGTIRGLTVWRAKGASIGGNIRVDASGQRFQEEVFGASVRWRIVQVGMSEDTTSKNATFMD